MRRLLGLILLRPPASNLLADPPDLGGQLFLDNLLPDLTAFAVCIRAIFQAGELLAPLPNQRVQPQQFSFQFLGLALCPFHYFKLRRSINLRP